jgi:hypothetical protein
MPSYAAGEYRYTEKNNPANCYGYKGSFLALYGRGTYHFGSIQKWDIYSGLNAGSSVSKIDFISNGTTTGALIGGLLASIATAKAMPTVVYNAFAGAARYFDNRMGMYAGLGYGITVVKVGATFYFGK